MVHFVIESEIVTEKSLCLLKTNSEWMIDWLVEWLHFASFRFLFLYDQRNNTSQQLLQLYILFHELKFIFTLFSLRCLQVSFTFWRLLDQYFEKRLLVDFWFASKIRPSGDSFLHLSKHSKISYIYKNVSCWFVETYNLIS